MTRDNGDGECPRCGGPTESLYGCFACRRTERQRRESRARDIKARMAELAWVQLGTVGVLKMLLVEHIENHASLADVDDPRELSIALWRAFRRRGHPVTDGVKIEGLE